MSKTVQNVNLYLPEFRRKKHWLDAEKMLLVAGAGVLLLVVVSGIEYWQLAQLRGELAVKEQEQRDVAQATVALLEEYGVQTEDSQLLDEIRTLEENLESKQVLLQFLEGRELGNAAGFSEHLAELSRHHIEGLSLSRVALSNGGRSVALEGQVIKPELVPMYVRNLGEGRIYSGMSIETMQIDDEPVAATAGDAGAPGLSVLNFHVRSLTRSP